MNEQFRTELLSYCINKVNFCTLSKTWLVTQGSSSYTTTTVLANPTAEIDEAAAAAADSPSSQEQHWGEILERTCSKQNLMLLNGNGCYSASKHDQVVQQTFPGPSSRMVRKSTLSLEMNTSQIAPPHSAAQ